MSKRLFTIHKVTKTAQSNKETAYNVKGHVPTFSGTPSGAVRKAMTYLCGKMSKSIKGRCTLTISIIEIKERMVDGQKTVVPKLDKDDLPYIMKYNLKRVKLDNGGRDIQIDGKEILFKYETKIIESFGRIL
jgi:hypothetical protein